ncbi:MAG: preprotein translocase subunit SecG [Acidobacteria bacterium]|nr:MAG: preprotein translocase subunit SecG [Acidobacteriota bacterium]
MKWAVALLIGAGIIVAGWRLADSRWFFWLLPTFFIANCLVLIVVVLLQSGKAADLAGAFGGAGSQTAFGPRGAANVLSKATTWCAVMFMLCAMAMVLRTDKAVGQGNSILERVSKPAPKPRRHQRRNPTPLLLSLRRLRSQLPRSRRSPNWFEIAFSNRSFDTLHYCLYDGTHRGRGGTGRRTSLRC